MSSLSISSNSLTLNPFALNSTPSINGIQSAQASQDFPQDSAAGVDTGSTDAAASTHISKQGQLLSKLQQLQQQDPAKFKQVVTEIATKLQAAAKNATGDEQKFLTDLADKFQKAESGDLSGFPPPTKTASGVAGLYQNAQNNGQSGSAQAAQGDKHGRHHHGGGDSGGGQQTLAGIFSELDSALGASTSGSATTATATTVN